MSTSITPRSGLKIGVLVPFTNVNLEPDMQLLCPPGCTMHFERLGGYDAHAIPGADQMAGLGASDLTDSIRLISGIRPAAVLYGCTSATLTHGREFDQELALRISKESAGYGVEPVCITAAAALMEAIKSLQATRVGFASPYLGEINDEAVEFMKSEGIETVAVADIGRELDNYGQSELTPDEVFELALRVNQPDVEAIVLSCTDMRSVEIIERLEMATGKPVVTSNQAMIYTMCRSLNYPFPDGFGGRLFEKS